MQATKKPPTKPRQKPEVSAEWAMAPKPGFPYGVLTIAVKTGQKVERVDYFCRQIQSDWGLGIELTKLAPAPDAGTTYHVNLAGPGEHACDCPGHNYHGHCKHVDELMRLQAENRLF